MPHITEEEVQQFLETSKLDLTAAGTDWQTPAATWASYVFGKMNRYFDTSTWTNEATTPDLVRQAIALLVAFTIHERAYSEDIESGEGVMTYGQRLKTDALLLIDDITEGRADIL